MISVVVDANCLAWGWGGIPRYVARITAELAKQPDLRVTLLANRRGPTGKVAGVQEANLRLKSGPLWRNAYVTPWLARHRPDVFWAPETLVPLWTPVPTVVTVHDLAIVRMPGIKPWRDRQAYRTARRTTRAAERVIAVSEDTARELERLWGISGPRVAVIPNGVDDCFRPGDRPAAKDAVHRRWRIAPHDPLVLFVGTMEPRKGLDVLLEAARGADRKGLPWRFVLAGAPGYQSGSLLSEAARLERWHAIGAVTEPELVDLYRAADVLVCPSLYEGFGITPLEAMACGTPAVIAANSGGLVETSGAAAVVVAVRTGEAWLAAILEAVTRRAELQALGHRHAARFRWPAVAGRTADVLRSAAQA